MRSTEKLNILKDIDTQIIFYPGFESALIGTTEVKGIPVAVYDSGKMIKILMKRDGLSKADAEDHFEFNIRSGYLGEHTPILVSLFKDM